MDVIKITDQLISERWKQQYYTNYTHVRGEWRPVFLNNGQQSSEDVYNKLVEAEAIDPTDFDKFDEIIGNNSWTTLFCNVCQTPTRKTLVSYEVNCGEYDFTICKKCLEKSLKKLEDEA